MKKYKKLVSAGCSLIHGSELGDEFPFSQQTYPALLAKNYGLEYDCIAYPSASNQGICKKVMEYDNKENCLFLIQWTYPSRQGVNLSYDYKNKEGNFSSWFDMAPNNWDLNGKLSMYSDYTQQLKNLGIDDLSEIFYKHLGNDFHHNFYTEISINSVELILRKNNCDFIFVAGCNDLLIHKSLINFHGQGFVDWCKNKKFEHGYFNHPLHEAHSKAFKYIKDTVNNLNL